MTVFGSAAPIRLRTRVSALVPERCIPRTRMQVRPGAFEAAVSSGKAAVSMMRVGSILIDRERPKKLACPDQVQGVMPGAILTESLPQTHSRESLGSIKAQ